MVHSKSFKSLIQDQKTVNLVFLGVGLILFMLNVSTLLAYLPVTYSYTLFNISVFSSMIVILVAVYNIHNN